MRHADVGTTNPSKLRALEDLRDHLAWVEFQERYEPLLRRCCARLGLPHDSADEVCQETWIEVAKRLGSFVYNPQRGTFRGWLWKVCHHKAMDFLGRRESERTFSWDERDECVSQDPNSVDPGKSVEDRAGGALAGDEEGDSVLTGLFREAEEIQAAVRRRSRAAHLGGVLARRRHALDRRRDGPVSPVEPCQCLQSQGTRDQDVAGRGSPEGSVGIEIKSTDHPSGSIQP